MEELLARDFDEDLGLHRECSYATANEPSEIVNFFDGATVFLTGGTGYLGGMFLEKLLRVCDGLRAVYVHIRPKKGKEVQTRFDELFDGPNYEPLKKEKPNYASKVKLIAGDLYEKNLGLSEEDINILIKEVDCVIHCGATVRFDESLKRASYINVRSVVDLIEIAKRMDHLKAFLYVSTAFSNCVRSTIEEKIYDPPLTGRQLLDITESLDDETLASITPDIIGLYPNTYAFTKNIAEFTVVTEGRGLPIAIHRPSIVIGSCYEPVPGWINNIYGATGVLLGAAVGILRAIPGKSSNKAEMIPADYAINCAFATIWNVGSDKSLEKERRESKVEIFRDVPVYNSVSSVESPITWKTVTNVTEKYGPMFASPVIVYHYFFKIYEGEWAYLIASFLFHTVPAYLVDFIAICLRKEPMMVKGYQKVNKFAGIMAYFVKKELKFTNDNTQRLWNKLKKKDRELFPFSMKNFDWDRYFQVYIKGCRLYVLKDPLDTLVKGYRKRMIVMTIHYTLVTLIVYLLCKLACFICRTVLELP